MARLQDYPTVTPTSSDNILIVQSTGQGLASVGSTLGAKMDKANPTGTGSLSLNKASGSTGANAVTLGTSCLAGGSGAMAVGYNARASGNQSFATGVGSEASGNYSQAEGSSTASGAYSHSHGLGTVANHKSQTAIGEYNVADGTANPNARGNYIEVVGNGSGDANRSNARTLDWSGNEVLAGGLKINGNQDVGIAPIGYNANTDRNTESVRQTAMRYLRTNCFSKGGSSSSVRYSGGYYFTYLFGGVTSYGYDTFVEFAQSLTSGEKIIYWGYNVSTDTFTKLFSIS